MRFVDYLSGKSGLLAGTLTDHIEAIQGTGTGDGITISSELILVDEDVVVEVVETNSLELVENMPNFIEEVGIIVELLEEDEEIVDVI